MNDLYAAGKTVAEIQKITGLGKSSVNGYLPYTKAVYKPEELSLNAERINIFRSRQQAVKILSTDMWTYVNTLDKKVERLCCFF